MFFTTSEKKNLELLFSRSLYAYTEFLCYCSIKNFFKVYCHCLTCIDSFLHFQEVLSLLQKQKGVCCQQMVIGPQLWPHGPKSMASKENVFTRNNFETQKFSSLVTMHLVYFLKTQSIKVHSLFLPYILNLCWQLLNVNYNRSCPLTGLKCSFSTFPWCHFQGSLVVVKMLQVIPPAAWDLSCSHS